MIYPEIFKEKMIRRMTGPDAISASALSRETNVAQSTLSKWLSNASYKPDDTGVLAMNSDKKSKRPQDWTAGEKLNAVLDSARLDEESLGSFLRENGLHETHLEQWRMQMLEGLSAKQDRHLKKKSSTDAKKVKFLERELKRKDAALAETAALLVLKKKVQQIWGVEDENTAQRSEK